MKMIVFLCALAVASCRSDDMLDMNRRILCALDGTAWITRSGIGDTSFVSRAPELDHLCQCIKEVKP